jgi:hypothetical protein
MPGKSPEVHWNEFSVCAPSFCLGTLAYNYSEKWIMMKEINHGKKAENI